jgi:hypothetical protein
VTQPIHDASLQPIGPQRGGQAKRELAQETAAVPFRALLDQIERSAERVAQHSRQELSRETLGDAVQDARTSLEQVLSLKERLLEEWRASQSRSAP